MTNHPSQLPTVLYAHGLSRRKLAFARRFLPEASIRVLPRSKRLPAGCALLLWGATPRPPTIAPDSAIVRIEDGFLRSVGLGAALVKPISWVVDMRGMHFDAAQNSDLEWLLGNTVFDEELVERAVRLHERILRTGLTKYNVGSAQWRRPVHAKKVILVPGQVESDASLKHGAPGIATNMELLAAVRRAQPQAHLVYKPHPDVVARLRAKGQNEDEALHWCDEVVTDSAINHLLRLVDEVHVLTSLAGFEALLRGKQVTCYGMPFYAGWGLTFDILPIPRRTRRLSLIELVAGTLILYPRYIDPRSGLSITAEQALDVLEAWRATPATPFQHVCSRVLSWVLSMGKKQ
jgi:capsular polysaccharide export protein